MLVDQRIIRNLCEDAGDKRTQRAKQYKEKGRVQITKTEYKDSQTFEISANVIGTENYKTYISVYKGEVDDITCNCQDYYKHYGVCKHTLATVMQFAEQEMHKEQKLPEVKPHANSNDYRNFKQMVRIFYHEEIDEIGNIEDSTIENKGTIKLEPKIIYDKFSDNMKVEFRIGDKKMYKIKNLSEFYTRMIEKEFYHYGEKLEFVHIKENFEEESRPLLDFLLKYAEIIKYTNIHANANYRYISKVMSETSIVVGNSGIDELFDTLKGKKVKFQRDIVTQDIEFTDEQPEIQFSLKKLENDQYSIVPNIEIFKVNIIKGKEYKYILGKEKLYRCNKEFENTNLKLLELFRQNYMTEVLLGKEQLSQLFSVILPKVKNAINIENISEEEIEKYQPKELEVEVYLDFDENDYLVAEVKFHYGDKEFNPLDEKQKLNFPRNIVQETKALNVFRKTGFMFDSKNLRFILPDNDKIYQFLNEQINLYMQKFDVLATDKFKTKQIVQPKIGSLGVRVENNLLSIDLSNMEIDVKELEEIMKKYTLKKKYHRLKDGSFVNLEENKEMEFLNKLVTGMDIIYKELENGEINLPVHRSLYLNQLLKGVKGTEIVKNSGYKEIVNGLDKDQLDEDIVVPKNVESILRYYQKTGFKWLKILDSYRFGGILADDMGLRKNHSNVICYYRLCTK